MESLNSRKLASSLSGGFGLGLRRPQGGRLLLPSVLQQPPVKCLLSMMQSHGVIATANSVVPAQVVVPAVRRLLHVLLQPQNPQALPQKAHPHSKLLVQPLLLRSSCLLRCSGCSDPTVVTIHGSGVPQWRKPHELKLLC